jgi:hemimethylated DNA binding protein
MCMKRSNNCSFQDVRNWPHYAVLVDEGDRPGSHLTYVVQEQLELMKNTEVSLL